MMNGKNVDWLTRGAGIGAIFFTLLTIILAFLYFRSTFQSTGIAQRETEPPASIDPTSTIETNPNQVNTPTPISTPVGKFAAITVLENGWQHYQNSEFNFAISIPPDWIILDNTAEEIALIVSENAQNYPEIDSAIKESDLNMVTAGLKFLAMEVDFDKLPSIYSLANLNIMVVDLPADMTLQESIEGNINYLHQVLGKDLQIDQEQTQLGNVLAYKIEFESSLEDSSGKIHPLLTRTYILLSGHTQYVVTFTDKDEFKDYAQLFDQIAQSFQLAE